MENRKGSEIMMKVNNLIKRAYEECHNKIGRNPTADDVLDFMKNNMLSKPNATRGKRSRMKYTPSKLQIVSYIRRFT